MDETNPFGLFLVTSGSKGDRLLFRYPYEVPVNKSSSAEKIKRSPYALLNDIKDELWIPQDEFIESSEKSLLRFDDKVLSTLFAVKPELCGQKFELKIENVRFIGHPTYLPHVSNREQSTITMFNVVFALWVLPATLVYLSKQTSNQTNVSVNWDLKQYGPLRGMSFRIAEMT